MTAAWRLKQRLVKKIGVLIMYEHAYDPGRMAISLDNRTYHNFYEAPPDRHEAWRLLFKQLAAGD